MDTLIFSHPHPATWPSIYFSIIEPGKWAGPQIQDLFEQLASAPRLKLPFSIYCQYNNYQHTAKMNFYTLLPNGYTNMLRMPALTPPQPQSNIPLILNFLKSALKSSIGNYASALQQVLLNQKALAEQAAPEPSKMVVIQVDSKGMEDKVENAQIQKIIDKENISEKQNHQSEPALKSKQNLIQNITNDQPSHSNNEAQTTNKKPDSTEKPKKDKTRNKKDIRSVSIPTISLILAAQLPQLPFTGLQLRKKRESLLRRQVAVWHQKLKNRRDKREIRMLNC